MRSVLFLFFGLICACTSTPKRDPAQQVGPNLTEVEIENYAQAAALILRPRLFRLDRSAITFYYEEKSKSGLIRSLEEARARLLTKPNRFDGMRTGLYSEADPKGSRSFGKQHPRLFVLEIPVGTVFLNDTHPTESERIRLIEALHLDLNVRQEYSVIHYIGNINGDDASRYKIETRVIELLGTVNRLYHFNEAAQKNCRYNGIDIALRLNDPAFSVIAVYSEEEIVEMSPMASKIKRLFNETSLLNDTESAPLPRKVLQGANEFAVSESDYKRWKERFILTCGARWAFEHD